MRFKEYINESETIRLKVKPSHLSKADWKKLEKIDSDYDAHLPFLIKILKKLGYKFEGRTPGKYSSDYWSKKGDNWRSTGDFEINPRDGFIDLEEIQI